GMTGRMDPPLRGAVVFTLAADHGVAAEGVSAYPREVTAQMVLNFLRGGAAINVLAREVGARVVGADVGVVADLPARWALRALQVNARSIARGPIDTLAAVGGLEIAGLVGVILAAAEGRKPAIIDGFISGASALVAAAMEPAASGYMIASHRSQELGHGAVLDRLGLHPLLDLDLRLGEGTGAALALPIVRAAVRLLNEMATFDEAGVS